MPKYKMDKITMSNSTMNWNNKHTSDKIISIRIIKIKITNIHILNMDTKLKDSTHINTNPLLQIKTFIFNLIITFSHFKTFIHNLHSTTLITIWTWETWIKNIPTKILDNKEIKEIEISLIKNKTELNNK